MMLHTILFAAAAASVEIRGGVAAATAATAATTRCESDLDCQLNGACQVANDAASFPHDDAVHAAGETPRKKTCVCDKGWKGPDCGLLNIATTPTIAYGYGTTPKTSSWGGGPPAYDNATGMYHLFMSEIAGNCGMTTWAHMSRGAHAVSKTAEGPYTRVETIIETEAHNIFYAYSPSDQMHLLYHIFQGNNPESCNPYFPCTNGSTPGATGQCPQLLRLPKRADTAGIVSTSRRCPAVFSVRCSPSSILMLTCTVSMRAHDITL